MQYSQGSSSTLNKWSPSHGVVRVSFAARIRSEHFLSMVASERTRRKVSLKFNEDDTYLLITLFVVLPITFSILKITSLSLRSERPPYSSANDGVCPKWPTIKNYKCLSSDRNYLKMRTFRKIC